MREAFTLFKFSIKKHRVKLIFPEKWQADGLYLQLQQNDQQSSLPGAKRITSPKVAAALLQQMQAKVVQRQGLYLILLIDGNPAGMLTLSTIKTEDHQKAAEVSYWLAHEYQGLGIMTRSLHLLTAYAFKQRRWDYLLIKTTPNDLASQQVAENCGFKLHQVDQSQQKVFILSNEPKQPE